MHQDRARIAPPQPAPTTTTESPSRFRRVVTSLTRRTPGKVNQKSTENAGPSATLPGAPGQTGQNLIEETTSPSSAENARSSISFPDAPGQTGQGSIEDATGPASPENAGFLGTLPDAPDQIGQSSIEDATSPNSPENADPSDTLPSAPGQTGQSSIEDATSPNSPENADLSGTLPGAPGQTGQSSIEDAADPFSTENAGPSTTFLDAPGQPGQGAIEDATANQDSAEKAGLWSTSQSGRDKTSLTSLGLESTGFRPQTPDNLKEDLKETESTPFCGSRGSLTGDVAKIRREFMALNLQQHAYQSPTLLELFLEGVPDIDDQVISRLHEEKSWEEFKRSCTGGKGKDKDKGASTSTGSNEKEFRALVKCVAGLKGLEQYFKRQKLGEESRSSDEPEQGPRRISHQGNQVMSTWNPQATWLKGSATEKKKELKPDFMTLRVKTVENAEDQSTRVIPIRPQTIPPPPEDWKANPMDDKSFPIVECKDPAWECLELFWECKRNQNEIGDPEVVLDCALKAAEALRYQWSRRFVCCFLHCGTKMQLLHFNRSGIMASEVVDVVEDTATFVKCLIGAFCHRASRLGFPDGPGAPYHATVDGKLHQIVTVQNQKLYLLDQATGPARDHLASRATVTFKAKLLQPAPTGGDQEYCFKSSWAQKGRQHEGEHLHLLQDTPGTVSILAYDVAMVELDDSNIVNDTTCLGLFPLGATPTANLHPYSNTALRLRLNLPQSTSYGPLSYSGTNQNPASNYMNAVPYEEREHRQTVCAWAEYSFNDAVDALIKQEDIPSLGSLWRDAFQAIDAIVGKDIMHRDISFRNMRVDRQNRVQVCDFDMATIRGNLPSGAKERTGTVVFMAHAILYGSTTHRPVHDCESVFWLCALSFLNTIAVGQFRELLQEIYSPHTSLRDVALRKERIINEIKRLKRGSDNIKQYVSINSETERFLFNCLVDLSKVLTQNDYDHDYETAEGEYEKNCFQQFRDTIAQSLAEDDIIKSTIAMSLDSGTSPSAP
jgi:hypothetical protein